MENTPPFSLEGNRRVELRLANFSLPSHTLVCECCAASPSDVAALARKSCSGVPTAIRLASADLQARLMDNVWDENSTFIFAIMKLTAIQVPLIQMEGELLAVFLDIMRGFCRRSDDWISANSG